MLVDLLNPDGLDAAVLLNDIKRHFAEWRDSPANCPSYLVTKTGNRPYCFEPVKANKVDPKSELFRDVRRSFGELLFRFAGKQYIHGGQCTP
jgi:hypothetical protein